MEKLIKIYQKFTEILDIPKDIFLLLIRVYWGWLFFQAGFGKFMHLERTIKFFDSLGLPAPELFAPFIASIETFGGILLIFGILSRLVGLILAGNMIGAFLVAHREALSSIISKPDEFYMALPFTFLMASLIILFCGSGKFSLDYIIGKKILKIFE